MMAGAVYCPLSSRDPEHRLQTLIEQTQSRVVLVHNLTRDKIKDGDIICDVDVVLNTDNPINDNDLDRLSCITMTPENIAYIIFTSGSTGIPKAVS